MRIIWFISILCVLLQSAEIDKRFFDPESKKAYLEQMEANVTLNKNKELSLLEATLLEKIKSQEKQSVEITYKKEDFVINKPIMMKNFENKIAQYLEAKAVFYQSENKINQLNRKLEYLKNQIRDITTDNKENLITYQLEYTLYRQVIEFEVARSSMLSEVMKYNQLQFIKMLSVLQTDTYEEALTRLQKDQAILQNLEEKKSAVAVKIENIQLLGTNQLDTLQSQMKLLDDQLDKAYMNTVKSMFHVALMELVQRKDEKFYNMLKKADSYIRSVTAERRGSLLDQEELLKSLAKSFIGVTTVAVIASKESLIDSLNYVISLLFKPLFVFNEKAVTSADILKVILIFLIGIFLASLYRRRMLRWSAKTKVLANFGYYSIILVTFFVAINSIGFDLTAFSMFASALAIGIGFGLQTVVSNMVSGIIMMFERSVRVGDFVELSDTLRGRVTDMRIRSTVIKTLDNIDIVVPNSSFIQNNVVNLTLEDTMRRLHVPFGVAYGTEVKKVMQVILDELEQSELHYYKGHDEDRQPQVRMTGMGASSVDYELLVWIDWDNKKQASTKSDFLILIYNTLYKHHIEIPYPQLDLHLKNTEQGITLQ